MFERLNLFFYIYRLLYRDQHILFIFILWMNKVTIYIDWYYSFLWMLLEIWLIFFLFTLNSDLRSSSPTTQHLISTAEGLTLAREVKAGFCEVSCKNNIGVKECIEHAVGLYAVFKRCHMYIHRSSKLMLCLIVFKTAMNSLENLIVLYIRMLINCKKLSRTFKICVPR